MTFWFKAYHNLTKTKNPVQEKNIEISILDYFEKCNVQIFLESNKMLKISPITKYSDNSIKSTVLMPFQQY